MVAERQGKQTNSKNKTVRGRSKKLTARPPASGGEQLRKPVGQVLRSANAACITHELGRRKFFDIIANAACVTHELGKRKCFGDKLESNPGVLFSILKLLPLGHGTHI
jgi:hypothetical protein